MKAFLKEFLSLYWLYCDKLVIFLKEASIKTFFEVFVRELSEKLEIKDFSENSCVILLESVDFLIFFGKKGFLS